MKRYLILAVLAAVIVPFVYAFYGGSEDQRQCSSNNAQTTLVIDACTRLIQSENYDDINLAVAYVNRGIAYGRKGQFDRAIQDFDPAIQLNPQDARAFNSRGNAYGNKGQHDRSIQDYDQAIQLNPKYSNAFNNRARAYDRKGQHDRAIQDLDEVIRLDPKNAGAFNNRGNAYANKGQHDRAIEDYDQAIRLHPKYAQAFGNRGRTYDVKRQYDRAIRDYDQALLLNPQDTTVLNNKAWLLATAQQSRIRNGGEAVRLARKAVLNKDIAAYFDTLAAALAEAGDYTSAIREQQRAIQMLRSKGRHDDVADFETRLNLYRQGRPYRR